MSEVTVPAKKSALPWILLIAAISLVMIFIIVNVIAPAMAPDTEDAYVAADVLEAPATLA